MKLKNKIQEISYEITYKYEKPNSSTYMEKVIYEENQKEDMKKKIEELCIDRDRYSEILIKKIKPVRNDNYYDIDDFTDLNNTIEYYVDKPKFDLIFKLGDLKGIPSYIYLEFYILNTVTQHFSIYLAEYTENYQYFSIKNIRNEFNDQDDGIYMEPILNLKVTNTDLKSLIENYRLKMKYTNSTENRKINMDKIIDTIYQSILEKIQIFIKML